MAQEERIALLADIMSQCMGALGEVISNEDRLLIVGRLEEYDEEDRTFQIMLHRGNKMPQGVLHRTPVKVQVSPRNKKNTVIVIYGEISGCSVDYWKITVEDAVVCSESRRSFRQKVQVKGTVSWEEDRLRQAECILSDISLVGVGFTCRDELPDNAVVTLAIPKLVENSSPYELRCTLVSKRNAAAEGAPPLWHYGVDLGILDERVEESLCKDIFALQAKSMSRR